VQQNYRTQSKLIHVSGLKLCSSNEHDHEHIGSATIIHLASSFVTAGQHIASHEVSWMQSQTMLLEKVHKI